MRTASLRPAPATTGTTVTTRWARDERGTYLVIWALLMVAIFTMVAIVIDLGQLRETRRQVQSTADLAALAAGPNIAKNNPHGACVDAVTYMRTNAPDMPALSNPCAGLPTTVAGCSNTSPSPTTWSAAAAPYSLTVTWPVTNTAIADAHFSSTGERDGQPCDRVMVSIARSRPTMFGGIVGVRNLTTHATAVVRATSGAPTLTPTLWLLDPDGCGPSGGAGSLIATGGGTVTVGTSAVSGVVTLDSNGTLCGGTQTTIATNGGSSIVATGPGGGTQSIDLFAMPIGATTCNMTVAHDCDTAASLTPPPVPLLARSTRGPVDWAYNCKIGYPAFADLTNTQQVTVEDCANYPQRPPYIDNLVTAVGTTQGTVPDASYRRWNADAGYKCNNPSTVSVTGNWLVDCPGGLSVSNAIEFQNGNVIFDGGLSISGSGAVKVNTNNPKAHLDSGCVPPAVVTPCIGANSAAATGAVMFFRSGGNVSVSGGGQLVLNDTMLYQVPDATHGNGYVSASGNTSPVWTAPTEGPFAGLSLWSEAQSGNYSLGGSGSLNVTGIFFAPRAAYFTITGNAPLSQVQAQFIAYDLKVSGGGSLVMLPPAAHAVTIRAPEFTLIR